MMRMSGTSDMPRHVYVAGPGLRVMAVRESVSGAQKTADQLMKRRGVPLSIWGLNTKLRPGSIIEADSSVFFGCVEKRS